MCLPYLNQNDSCLTDNLLKVNYVGTPCLHNMLCLNWSGCKYRPVITSCYASLHLQCWIYSDVSTTKLLNHYFTSNLRTEKCLLRTKGLKRCFYKYKGIFRFCLIRVYQSLVHLSEFWSLNVWQAMRIQLNNHSMFNEDI